MMSRIAPVHSSCSFCGSSHVFPPSTLRTVYVGNVAPGESEISLFQSQFARSLSLANARIMIPFDVRINARSGRISYIALSLKIGYACHCTPPSPLMKHSEPSMVNSCPSGRLTNGPIFNPSIATAPAGIHVPFSVKLPGPCGTAPPVCSCATNMPLIQNKAIHTDRQQYRLVLFMVFIRLYYIL